MFVAVKDGTANSLPPQALQYGGAEVGKATCASGLQSAALLWRTNEWVLVFAAVPVGSLPTPRQGPILQPWQRPLPAYQQLIGRPGPICDLPHMLSGPLEIIVEVDDCVEPCLLPEATVVKHHVEGLIT